MQYQSVTDRQTDGHLCYSNTSAWIACYAAALVKKRVIYFRCAECPANFTRILSVNGCYKVIPRKREWSVAGLECRSVHKDAHLLVINDAQEQAAVAGMLASSSRQFVSCFLYTLYHVLMICLLCVVCN